MVRSGMVVAVVLGLGCGDAASGDTGGSGGTEGSVTGGAASEATASGEGTGTATVTATGTATATETATGDATGDATGGEPGEVPGSGCAGRLEPVAHIEPVQVVGDGSAASCSEQALHDAVAQLNAGAGGTLTFACGGAHSFTLTSSLFVARPTIIDGAGEITLSGGNTVRVIELDHYVDFVAQGLTIRDGFVAAGSPDESGAGILHPWFGTLKVIDTIFENNHSASQDHDVGGGAIYAGGLTEALLSGCSFIGNSGSTGGAVLSRSTNLRVVDSVFRENSATTYGESGQYGNGGGLYIDRMWIDAPVDFVICGSEFTANHAKVHGSALFSYNLEGGGALVDRCSFIANDMAGSPGGGAGSVYHEGVPLRLVDSTFADNEAGAHAGGLFLGGGTDAEVSNCTFSGNRTPGNAGALWAGNGVVAVSNSTFAGNAADYGPVFFKGQGGTVTLTNVVLAGNSTANEFSALACHETFADGGGNVQWPDIKTNGNPDTPCAAGVLFADPQLGPLADNGGPTRTMAIGPGSPAVDIAPSCSEFDQRGLPRSGLCDAGAYELQP